MLSIKHGLHFSKHDLLAQTCLNTPEEKKRWSFRNNGRGQPYETSCRRVLDDCDVSVLRLLLVERFCLSFEWHVLRGEIKPVEWKMASELVRKAGG